MTQRGPKIFYLGCERFWWQKVKIFLSSKGIRCVAGREADFSRLAAGVQLLVVDRYQGPNNPDWVADLILKFKRQGFTILVVGTTTPDQDSLFLAAGAKKVLRGRPEPAIFLGIVENQIYG